MQSIEMDDNMTDDILKELFLSVKRAYIAAPFSHMPYQALALYYRNKGNRYQEYICLRQAYMYCDDENDRQTISDGIRELEDQGIHVPKTAIIILSWNLLDFTRQCIDSIRKTTSSDDVQIIVVDNASTDGSVEWLKSQDDLIVRYNDENEGFPRGCNQGIELADPEYDIYLLNNDTILPHNALFWLKIGLYENDSVGATGSFSNYAANLQIVEEQFDTPDQVMEYAYKHNVPLMYPYDPKIWLVGYSMLIRRIVLDEIGLLDEMFSPGNSEDVDLGIRIRLAGYENYACRNSVILHFGSKSFSKLGNDYKEMMIKNLDKLRSKYGIDLQYYLHPRRELAAYIDREVEAPIKVLEFGCGTGATLAYIRSRFPYAEVHGVEIVSEMAKVATSVGDVICDNLETMEFPWEDGFFDYCIMGDVLEHLHEPAEVLRRLHRVINPDGKILVSMPNVKHWSVMLPLILHDRFEYVDAGILDRTHLRMYTRTEIVKLIHDSGFDVRTVDYSSVESCPLEYQSIIDTLKQYDRADNPDAYEAYQYIVSATVRSE